LFYHRRCIKTDLRDVDGGSERIVPLLQGAVGIFEFSQQGQVRFFTGGIGSLLVLCLDLQFVFIEGLTNELVHASNVERVSLGKGFLADQAKKKQKKAA
jgi:hypothetical protein